MRDEERIDGCQSFVATWCIACGSKVFDIQLLPIFRPQGEKSATEK
jgi:hypothetical protein